MGNPYPVVDHDVLSKTLNARPMRTSEKIERFFLALDARNFDAGSTFRYAGIMDDEAKGWAAHLAAWTEVKGPGGGLDIIPILQDKGFILPLGGSGAYRLTALGYDQLESITAGRTQFDQGFVAMWFGAEMSAIYDQGIAPAITDAGYRPMRIDRKEHNNKIDDEIIAEIRRSRFLIADMTCGTVETVDGKVIGLARGGVYYEAGFAQGLSVPVIWCARAGTMDHVHFDTRQYSHIVWTDAADLRQKLKVRIGAVLGYGPLATS